MPRISKELWPRPVCLVVVCDKSGRQNIMTVSFVMPISFNPKYVAFSIAPERYSFRFLQEVPEFTLNVASTKLLREAWICGRISGREADKFSMAKLTPEKSKKVKPVMIKEAAISYECVVEEFKQFGDHFLVVGRVVNEVVRSEDFEPLLHYSGNIFPTLAKRENWLEASFS